MNPLGFVAVGFGAALGAWARWLLGIFLNPLLIGIPLGTLAANLIGGGLVGVAVGVFHLNSGLPPALKLFVITGFLGGLTTFSTFSAEVVERFLAQQYGWSLLLLLAHLLGSLIMTFIGLWAVGAHRLWS
ncbi:MAG: fluoride efflux transporter CrcB [Pseudomonadota bacterium]|jgi:CrcB protein